MTGNESVPRDSEKITGEDFAARSAGKYCHYDGDDFPPGATICMLGKTGNYTFHVCVDGIWVSTGVTCEPENR